MDAETDLDRLVRENEKLRRINVVLMRRVEQENELDDRSYKTFQYAATLEEKVRARTQELGEALDQLRVSHAQVGTARAEAEKARTDLTDALEAIREGFALFDERDRLILSNSRFCADLPDVIAEIRSGMDYLDYVNLVAASAHLHRADGQQPENYVALRLGSHKKNHANFIVELTDDRWLQVSEQRTPSDGTAVIQTDITEMIRREREERDKVLDAQSQMVRATLDHIRQGVCIFDARRRLVGWNRRLRELMMLPVHLMQTGTHFAAIIGYFHDHHRISPASSYERLIDWVGDTARREPLTMEITREDGAVLDLFAQETPDRGYVISFTDVTPERRAIEALHRANETLEERVRERTGELDAARLTAERANTSKSRFLASASHDLLQPLSAAKLFLSSLCGTSLAPEQKALVERVNSAFESVESILGSLLDISKLEMGMARTSIECFPLAQVFGRLADEFQSMARDKGLELRIVPSRLWIKSDRIYFRRILDNLVANAIRYTETGRVLVGARRRGGVVRIEVWDTGPGIPEAKMAEVFQEFTRLSSTAGGGVGLGLSIVEQACALLLHPLDVRSELGRGTIFTVAVPNVAPVESDGGRVVEEAPVGPLDDMIVLVVENDPEVRAGMVGLLESWGASPLDAGSLAEARALVAEVGPPDVLLADYHLDNGEDGLAVVEDLRITCPELPAVMVTADRSPELRDRTGKSRITLLHKPLPAHQLRLVLHQIKLPNCGGEAGLSSDARPGDPSYWIDAFMEAR